MSVVAHAVLSACGAYRYRLSRAWEPALDGHEGAVAFVMLNPSTADAETDDPTVRRCRGFARDLGYAELVIVNLYAWRSTDPDALLSAPDPVGPDNSAHVEEVTASAALVIVAWGAHPAAQQIPAQLIRQRIAGSPYCLGRSKEGAPRHPGRLPAAAKLEPYRL